MFLCFMFLCFMFYVFMFLCFYVFMFLCFMFFVFFVKHRDFDLYIQISKEVNPIDSIYDKNELA